MHDQCKKAWYYKDTAPKPYIKDKEAPLITADPASADFGWLQSPDRKINVQCIMKPGKN
jgi:hypothetical protein